MKKVLPFGNYYGMIEEKSGNTNRVRPLEAGALIRRKKRVCIMNMLEGRMEARGTERSRKIGAAMREDRKNAGYTIRDLAKKMDISPTHLTRIETGERLMDSVEGLILFCKACSVPIDKYLALCGSDVSGYNSPIHNVFPSIESPVQESALSEFAKIITTKKLTEENIQQMLNTAIAFADFCDKQNQAQE